MITIDDRTFRFKSGYIIRVRDDYDPRLFQMTQEAYKDSNPPPDPPIIEREVPVKGGTRTITRADYQDENYLRAYAIWEMQMYSENTETLYDMAIDLTSVDMEVVEGGRLWYEQQGIGVPRNDVRAYLRFVTTPPKPGKEAEGELLKFHRWLSEVGGPSDALVNSFIDNFRATLPGKTDIQRVPPSN